MNEIRYTIETRLPTLNEYIKIERGNTKYSKILAANEKKRYTEACSYWALSQLKGVRLTGLYDVKIIWNVTDNKTDSDNIYFGVKFILDGLSEAEKSYTIKNGKKVIEKHGILYGDGRKFIRNISHEIRTTNHYLVTVILTEVNQ